MASNEQHMKGDLSTFAQEMKKLINNKDTSDIRFLIGPSRKSFYAHRCILSARCDVFRAIFSEKLTKTQDGEVPFVLSDMKADIFQPMLEYIYTNCVTLNSKIAIDVLGTALEYDLDGLRKTTIEYLIDNLAINNVCEVLQAAVKYNQPTLQSEAMEFIENNTKAVTNTQGFHILSDDALAIILRSDHLSVDEVDLLDAVKEWASVNSAVYSKSRPQVASKVVAHLRLPLLSPDELKVVEEENLKEKLIPAEQLSFAWRCHALKQVEQNCPQTTRRNGTRARDSHRTLEIL